MHIPDGFLTLPAAAGAMAVSAGGLAYGIRRLDRNLQEGHVPLLGVMGAFIFAAQMLNFPVIAGTSGHLLGAALAAILLGPWAATVVMACILLVQSLLFQDGGLLALGANTLNMGLLASLAGYYTHRGIVSLAGQRSYRPAAFVAAWISVVLSAAATALELALSGIVPWQAALPAMAGMHALIGLGEGAITVTALSLVKVARKDLLELQKI